MSGIFRIVLILDWINFRLDKFYDNLQVRLNMIEFCIYILNKIDDDAIILFNGELLVLERINGILKINDNFGFWNSNLLVDKLKSINQQ